MRPEGQPLQPKLKEKKSLEMRGLRTEEAMNKDAWMIEPSQPSRRGNVMEIQDCFQTLRAIATT